MGPASDVRADAAPWWRDAVVYQVYPRSYADTNGDGVGDLAGIIAHLDHLEWLGVDTIWSSPVTVSPNADWGYDVADFCDVDPALGTLADLDTLVAAADARGIRVLLDLVPNHTSIEHPWFVDARASRDAPHRDWYVWADPAPDGGPPNNWVSTFLGPGWELDDTTGQYFLHSFLPEQPDLNWWNEGVRDEFDRILRFWFDRGVAGFRIDVAHMVVKDALLRDNPPATEQDYWMEQLRGQRQEFNSCRPEVHDVYRRWRAIADTYDPPRVLLGETHVFDVETLASFYGDDDELGLAFNFMFMHDAFDPAKLRAVVAETEAALPTGAWPVWAMSNHDISRFPTRWCAGDDARARCALVLLLTLRGTPVLYYGDELGLPDTVVPDDRLRDPVTIAYRGVIDRDGARTPMPWADAPGGGFTDPAVEPWLPFGDLAAHNVADQRADAGSTLHLVRDLLALRRASRDLRRGAYADLGATGACWSFRRGDRVQVVLNLGADPVTVPVALAGARGVVSVAVASDRVGEGDAVGESVEVEGGRAVVLVAGAGAED
ncbi:MAG: alpha-amylase family glycosyl hydrolase [Acidimicrobiia bacterium]|jgi:alpha-glucosidase